VNKILNIISHSEKETLALAEKLVPSFRQGDILILTGKLGSGKTVFVKGMAAALGIDTNLVNSPSFKIVNEYYGKYPFYHLDLYRINDPYELNEIGWEQYVNSDGLVAVEWGEKAAQYISKQYYKIVFDIIDDNQREINISIVENE